MKEVLPIERFVRGNAVFKDNTNKLLLLITFVSGAIVLSNVFGTACPIRLISGLPCPACGMTRACMAALRFDFSAAFYYHPLFPLGICAVLLCVAAVFLPDLTTKKALTVAAGCAAAAVIAVFVWRLAFKSESFMPLQYSYDSLVGILIKLCS